VTAIQDEAHRFAGNYNKKLMTKRNTRFSLEGIEGIGPARRKSLVKTLEVQSDRSCHAG
jgi:excinuclease ABC subunit C